MREMFVNSARMQRVKLGHSVAEYSLVFILTIWSINGSTNGIICSLAKMNNIAIEIWLARAVTDGIFCFRNDQTIFFFFVIDASSMHIHLQHCAMLAFYPICLHFHQSIEQ